MTHPGNHSWEIPLDMAIEMGKSLIVAFDYRRVYVITSDVQCGTVIVLRKQFVYVWLLEP